MDDRTMAQTKKKKAKERTPQITLLDRTNESISLDELTRTADENASYDVSISSSAGSSSSSNNNNNSNNNDNSSSRNTSCSSNCSRSSNTNSSISKTSSVGLGRPKRGTMAMVRSNETHGTEVDESGNDDDNDSDENHRDSRVSASQKLHRCVEEAAHNRRRVPQRLEHAAATHHHAPQRSGKAAAASMARREGGNQPKVVQKLPPRSRAPERSRRSRLASHDDDETAESDDESPSNVEEQTEVDDADEEKRQLNELLTSICPELLAEFFCFLDERYMFSPFAGLLCLECNVKLNFSFGGHDGYRTGPMEAIQWHEKNHHEDDMKDLSDRQKAVKSLRCRFHTFASSYASWDTEDRRKVLLRYTLGSGDLLQCWLCDQCGQCVHYADNTHQARNGGACSGGSYIDTEGHFHRWWKLDKSSYPPILPKDFTPEDILCLLHPDIRQLIRSAGGQSVAELYSNVCLSHYNESECIGSGGYKHVIAFPVPSRKEDKPMQVAALV
jgi:hypothetical protein